MGYSYEQAKQLPTWLFISLLDGAEKDRVRGMVDRYQAVGAAGQGFTIESSKKMVGSWQKYLDRAKAARKPKQDYNSLTREDVMKAWGF